MKVKDILYETECYESTWADEEDNILEEAAVRQWKMSGKKRVMKYRCMSGPKKGRLVSKPGACGIRKDPKKKRVGKRVMRSKKRVIQRKSQITKKKGISKMLQKLNARLMGKI